MKKFFHSRLASFKYAFEGWWHVIRTQQNAWIHALASILAILFSFWLKISGIEWALVIIAIAFVWTAEFFNTALEAIVDLTTQDQHPLAKAAKDVSAAAVLIAALMSVVIGLLVLGPPLLEKLQALLH
jgi:diacylglycerol kinase